MNPSFEDGLDNWTVSDGLWSVSSEGVDGDCAYYPQSTSVVSISQSVNLTDVSSISFYVKSSYVTVGFYVDSDSITESNNVAMLYNADWNLLTYNVSSYEGIHVVKFETMPAMAPLYVDLFTTTLISTEENNTSQNSTNSTGDNSTGNTTNSTDNNTNETTGDILINSSISIISSENGIVIISLIGDNGIAINDVEVKYVINEGSEVSDYTDSNGQITIKDLSGEINIKVTFAGNENYTASNSTISFNFTNSGNETNTTNNTSGNITDNNATGNNTNETNTTSILSTSISITSNEEGTVVITLKDETNKIIPNIIIKYSVNNGNEVSKTTNEQGSIQLNDLTGETTIKAIFEGNDLYSLSNNTVSFNFTNTNNTNGNTTNSSTHNTTGNNTSNATDNTTDNNNTVTKVATKLTATNVNMVYNGGKSIVITLKDANGNVLDKKQVSITINGKTYYKTTNSNGQASISVNLIPKTYTATIKFAGDDKYTSSSTKSTVKITKATPKLTAKKKTFKVKTKTKKYTITLKNNKNKVLKNTKVTIKVKGKTYTAKTNSKGVATFKLTKLTKKGTFKAVVKFAGNKYYKSLSKTVKITVKK